VFKCDNVALTQITKILNLDGMQTANILLEDVELISIFNFSDLNKQAPLSISYTMFMYFNVS